MPRRRSTQEVEPTRRRPATTPEEREQQLVSLAYDLAEKQIDRGEASSQVITHFLKLGSTREVLEQQRIQHENELLQVKMKAIESQERVEAMYVEAMTAMRSYTGQSGVPETDEPD